MTVGGGATSGARDLLNLPQYAWIHRGSPTVRADAPEPIGASAMEGVGTTCPATSEGKTCNQHYCASCQLHVPQHAPCAARRHVCSECALACACAQIATMASRMCAATAGIIVVVSAAS